MSNSFLLLLLACLSSQIIVPEPTWQRTVAAVRATCQSRAEKSGKFAHEKLCKEQHQPNQPCSMTSRMTCNIIIVANPKAAKACSASGLRLFQSILFLHLVWMVSQLTSCLQLGLQTRQERHIQPMQHGVLQVDRCTIAIETSR